MVGCDVVPDLENELAGKVLFRCFADGNRLDIGTALHDDGVRLCGRCGHFNQVVVDAEMGGNGDFGRLSEGARVGKDACDGGCRRGLRRDEIDLGVRGAAARLKVAVEGAQGNAAGFR